MAFHYLYDRYAERINRFHFLRSRDRDAALDLTAETFAQAWISRERFRDLASGSAAPWLFAIARHVLAASVRQGKLERSARERLDLLEALGRPPALVEVESSWLDGLDDALRELSTNDRAAIRLRVLDERSYEEVAASLGTSEAAARVRVHRALNSLRNRLTTREATR